MKLFGGSKDFVGTGFFSCEFGFFKCAVCGVKLEDITRLTCSVGCIEKYRSIMKSNLNFYRTCEDAKLRELNREEFVLFMQEKYCVKN